MAEADQDYQIGSLEQAQKNYKEALKHNPKDHERINYKIHEIDGDLAVRQAKRQEAVDAYTQAKTARPTGDFTQLQPKLDYAQGELAKEQASKPTQP